MSRWTDEDFHRVAAETKVAPRTLAACREVLVDGASGVEASARHKMAPPQVSRALTVLREKREELSNAVVTPLFVNQRELQRHIAGETAKAIVGPNLPLVSAAPGKTYEGPVIVNTHGFVVQKVGPTGVIHDASALESAPAMNVPLSISYPDQGKAVVSAQVPSVSPGKGIGR